MLHDASLGEFRKVLRSPGGLPSNQLLCATVSPSGMLWAGMADRGVARLRTDGSFRRALTSFDGLPSDRVQTLFVRGDSIWIGTAGGVALFTENPVTGQATLRRADTVSSTGGALAGNDVRSFAQIGDTLWCGTATGVSSFASGAWQNRAAALSAAVPALAAMGDTLWASSSAGPQRYAAGAFALVAGGHSGGSVSLRAGPGALYSGSTAASVFRYEGGSWSALGSGLPAAPVASLALLPDGSLWAATPAGLARLDAPAWTLLPSDGPLVDRAQRATVDAQGVWFSTDGALLADGSLGAVLHHDGTRWLALTAASTGGRLEASDVYGILSDRGGRIWIGHCCGPSEPKPRAERFDPADSAWAVLGTTNLYAFAESSSGRVFGGSVEHGSGIYEFDRATGALLDSLTPANTQGGTGPGLASNNLRGIAFDAQGKGWFVHASRGLDLWVGNGTSDHSDDVWTHVEAGLPSAQGRAVAVVSPSLGWVGTTAGVARIEGGVITRAITATTTPALPSGQVNDLAADSQGNLWIATAAGLARVDAADGSLERFTSADGLIDDDVRALAWDPREGALWVGTARGIAKIHPARQGDAGFSEATFVFPNPLRGSSSSLKLGGITNVVQGEIRDLGGTLLHRFRCDPSSLEIWNLRRSDGTPAPAGVYLVVLRDRGTSRILRAALIR